MWHRRLHELNRLTFAMGIRGNTEANVKPAALAARFVEAPHVSAPDNTERRLAEWLADVAPEQSAALDSLIARFPSAKAILLGIAESSPYLFDLVRADGARALRLLGCEPERHLPELIANTCGEVSAASTEADVMQLLRAMKSEAALLIALCDIGGGWPGVGGAAALTELAAPTAHAPPPLVFRPEARRA